MPKKNSACFVWKIWWRAWWILLWTEYLWKGLASCKEIIVLDKTHCLILTITQSTSELEYTNIPQDYFIKRTRRSIWFTRLTWRREGIHTQNSIIISSTTRFWNPRELGKKWRTRKRTRHGFYKLSYILVRRGSRICQKNVHLK